MKVPFPASTVPARASVGIACLLFGVVCVAYAPCFSAAFLNYDDPWLIVNNQLFEPDARGTLAAIWADLRFETRFALGAEYLPMRDTLVWLQTALFGKSAQAMHTISVLVYACTCLLFRKYLQFVLGAGWAAEVSAFLFALHPVHVESVAWLAGQKDVLALLFSALALFVHAKSSRHGRVWVPFFIACACFSKSMSVAVVVLIAATDLALERRFDRVIYAASGLVIAGALAVHLYVGSIVHMIAAPLGGSRLNAFWSMGPVWLRYVGLCLFPAQLSIEHVVEPLSQPTLSSVAGYTFVALSATFGLYAWRRSQPLAALVFLWFFGPLLPVSQVLAPLQNRMADRYLWLSVMAPALIAGFASAKLVRKGGPFKPLAYAASAIACLALGAATFDRALTFSDSVLLFSDGSQKTATGTLSPYQLGSAFEQEGRLLDAEVAYREVLRRAPVGPVENARRATNNLAKLLSSRGQLPEAEQVLRKGLLRFPDDHKMRNNLAKVLENTGREREAAAWRTAPKHQGAKTRLPEEP